MLRALFIATLLLPCTAFASSVVALPEDELLAHADVVVVGSVSQIETYLDAKAGIRTRALLQVHQGIRGVHSEGDVLTLDIPGGTYRGLRSVTSGTPTLVQGQLMLVFLEAYGKAYRPLGLSYGVYNVSLSAGSWRAVRDLNGLSLLNRQGKTVNADLVRSSEDLNVILLRLQKNAKVLDGVK